MPSVTTGPFAIEYRDWTRGETKGLDELEFMDFICDEAIEEITRDDTIISVDDLLYPELMQVIKAIAEGVDPNATSGSRRRQRTRK